MMNPGATPKDTTSDKESKSAPMGEWALSSRAVKPSRKSKRPAAKIMMAALTGMFMLRNRIERQPETRLPQVIVLGMCCLRFIILFRCVWFGKGSVFVRKNVFLQKFLPKLCSINSILYKK